MTPGPLDYRSAANERPRLRVPWRAVIALLAAMSLFFGVTLVGVRQVRNRVDAITGSVEWQTTWPLGFTSGPAVQVSPLEARLTKAGIPWSRDWRFLHNTHRTLLGNATLYECGSAPPMYELRPALQEFVDASTDDELRQFMRVMQSGTEAEQKAVVRAAYDKIFNSPTPVRAGVN